MVALPAYPKEIAGGNDAHRGGQMGDGVHQVFSSRSAFGRGHPNRAPIFLNINDDPGVVYFGTATKRRARSAT